MVQLKSQTNNNNNLNVQINYKLKCYNNLQRNVIVNFQIHVGTNLNVDTSSHPTQIICMCWHMFTSIDMIFWHLHFDFTFSTNNLFCICNVTSQLFEKCSNNNLEMFHHDSSIQHDTWNLKLYQNVGDEKFNIWC